MGQDYLIPENEFDLWISKFLGQRINGRLAFLFKSILMEGLIQQLSNLTLV